MPAVCLYFQVHQPFRLRRFGPFEADLGADPFDDALNAEVCRKAAHKGYLPANALLLELLERHPGFRVSFSISGTALEQFERYSPETLRSFRALVATGRVELLAETYYHSLAALFDGDEFRDQVRQHAAAVHRLFGVRPVTFRNTELIYSDGIAEMVHRMGFRTLLTEGVERTLEGRSPDHVYEAAGRPGMALLLKNYRLSDDIAYRFTSHAAADGTPLRADRYAGWLHALDGSAELVNLFMDYETFGEHLWEESGIFEFLRGLPAAVLRHPSFSFMTPAEAAARLPRRGVVAVPDVISWADLERDTSAWLGNPMQDGAAAAVYALRPRVLAAGDRALTDGWRRLQTSDHYYYMCTKQAGDGAVHDYFSCYGQPHEAYAYLNNALAGLELRLEAIEEGRTAAAAPGAASAHRPAARRGIPA